jgi:putative membrane protein
MFKRIGLTGIGLTSMLASTAPAFADGAREGVEYGHHMMFGGGWGMMFGPILMIGIIVLVVVAVVMFLRQDRKSGPGGRALDVLNERYAQGDIDHDDYEERKRRLTA